MKAINHAINNNIKAKTIVEIEETHFLAIEQLDLGLVPMLQKLGPRLPNVHMAVLWNPDGQTVILKRNMTIIYVTKSDYMEKFP